ncbi:MAG: sugar transferase [Chloroflexi bacterium]|nr:sugar transferase [Chloroflexota bacterium]
MATDCLALLCAFSASYLLRFENPQLPYFSEYSSYFYSWLAFWSIPIWIGVFALYRLYDLEQLFGGVDEYSRVTHACSIGVIVLIFYSFLDRDSGTGGVSRLWLVFVWLLSIALVGSGRFAARRLVYALRRQGHLRRRALVVGANSEAVAIGEQLLQAESAGIEVVGYVDNAVPDLTSATIPVLGSLSELTEIVARRDVDELIIAATAVTREQLLEIYNTFGFSPHVEIRVSPGLYEILTTGARIRETGYMPLVSLNRMRITGVDAALKRTMDIGLIMLASPLLAVVLPLLALLVRLDSPGPIIHRRRVMGVGGRAFNALKFRTMVTDAEERLAALLAADPAARAEFERERKLKVDPRITSLGRILRRTSLDELPQLANVLRGQMSLVGPRMIAPDEIKLYGHWWMNLLTVKPGITGPWQVMGRNELPYAERVRLSMKYIRNHTAWLDVQILVQTIFVVLRGTGM